MELKINRFKFSFFLPFRQKVTSLENGAMEFGGATKVKDEIYSNYGFEESNTITTNEKDNELSLFVPSTLNIDKKIDNSNFVEKYLSIMSNRFDNLEAITNCKGSWYSSDKGQVVIEDIVIIKAYVHNANANDIMFMEELAKLVKEDMSQEGVTITINDSLAIV